MSNHRKKLCPKCKGRGMTNYHNTAERIFMGIFTFGLSEFYFEQECRVCDGTGVI